MRQSGQKASLWSSLVLVGVALLGAVGCGGGEARNGGGGDPELVGNWSGKELSSPSSEWTFAITDTTVDVQTSGIEAYKGTYTADPTSNPRQLTIVITDGAFAAYVGKNSNAIYKIEETTLTLAGNEPGISAMPTSFATGGTARIFVLTKQ